MKVFISYGDEENEKDADEILDVKAALVNTRYLNLREYVTKNRSMNEILFTYSDRDFNQVVRMRKPSFVRMVDLIQHDEILKTDRRTNKQQFGCSL